MFDDIHRHVYTVYWYTTNVRPYTHHHVYIVYWYTTNVCPYTHHHVYVVYWYTVYTPRTRVYLGEAPLHSSE